MLLAEPSNIDIFLNHFNTHLNPYMTCRMNGTFWSQISSTEV